ncbi:hypothetical protein FRC02_001694 [Tulasnella sp. 418]|nr:hypothetical protein FRC02_001694 [Tulasnella sp. 418]
MSLAQRVSRASLPRGPLRTFSARAYATQPAQDKGKQSKESTTDSTTSIPKSSCLEGTVLEGLTYLKGQPPVVARPDSEYPAWLWTLLKPKAPIPKSQDMPTLDGSKETKKVLRRINRKSIRDTNFNKAN